MGPPDTAHVEAARRLLCWATLVVVLGMAARAGAVPPGQFAFRTFNVDQGLQNLAMWGLAQDDDGFLWFGTEEGLYRYDGSRFERFDTMHPLPSTTIHAMATGRSGVWVGTNKGL